ncbi:cytochrome c551 peroxidase' /EC_number= [Formosa agariphila KMM 3901]|uniref:'cytochrome c551 peroxidase' /EC_number n=1 Tax=Formosa agariphila (strain DSM 15362 / KCTC 12365 / LMG 23005 / KMM 3901 / M-2Alg 35-1) TaxID=1347342 RepID=T2KM33_FORAG|nr:cytochrome c551 peroxidase' /EC_number= [Formosa agariphila KMM 3901]
MYLSCNDSKESTIGLFDNAVYIPLPKTILSPKDNPTTPEKVALGKLLFYDPILSGNKDVACATCHHPDFGYAELKDLSIGVNGKGLSMNRKFNSPNNIPIVKRNAHTILNTAFNGINVNGEYSPEKAAMFWDSREESLEKQALAPIKTLEEMMGHSFSEDIILDTIVNRLRNIPEYVLKFQDVFKTKPAISSINLGKAIAAFERTLVTNNSRFDQYIAGDSSALSYSEKKGFNLFKKANCHSCHSGPMFSDFKMHVLTVPENEKLNFPDDGFEKTYAFRTPTLRNLRYTAPYMHNGKFENLLEVLEFYEDIASGVSKNSNIENEKIDSLIKKIDIKVIDMQPIISFFNSLNDDTFDKVIPENVPSKLPVGGNIFN